ncbi:pyridoxal phosphate-dependent decarboxylase family protein [Eleftheria terrae]|uniref:pyridoxal phosphate-dependent decarboxylase family protein n=1 Tax=Eleftheria terrae TaxID=1597781 RepID=UPI00263A83AE|nr:aminotransferase class V-fold PLP-dependent enzyme [Eleftheria terrae]WKB54420.1 aminotransferase class V-fold PLP-dependent enzyme [Eleftheria terrae]
MTVPSDPVVHKQLPLQGRPWSELEQAMTEMRDRDADWRRGRTPLHVYFAGDEVLDVARRAYAMFMSENALAPAAFPSLGRMEQEVVGMALALLGGGERACGTLTSGGTESIILAVRSAWQAFRRGRGTPPGRPHLLLPDSAHPAYDKAADLMGLAIVRVPLGDDYRACLHELRRQLRPDTVMMVASAPCLPFGTIDPVEAIGELALEHGVWLHVDACIGGFLAPFVARFKPDLPRFDLAVPGVRSLSADLHKFGYAAKGASLVLYADAEDQQGQHFAFGNWPKGLYRTETLTGTRPGGAVAAAWAVMHHLGEAGYLAVARRVMDTRDRYVRGLQALPGVRVLGQPPLSVLAYTADRLDVHALGDGLEARGWYVSRLSAPPALHMTVTPAHAQAVEAYLQDVQALLEQPGPPLSRGAPRRVVTY